MDSGRILIWLSETTIIVSLLISIIFILRSIIKHRINPNFVYCLWFVVLIKLIVPYGPESSISIYNIFSNNKTIISEEVKGKLSIDSSNFLSSSSNVNEDIISDKSVGNKLVVQEEIKNIEDSSLSSKVSFYDSILLLWISGILISITYSFSTYFRFIKSTRNNSYKIDYMYEMLVEVKRAINVRRNVSIVITDMDCTPALYGSIKPKILIPQGLIDELTEEQIKYIFLHELCHLKRGDILIAWITTIVKAVYWFNPLVHIALRTMANDCEMACDNMVLSYINKNENISYGNTIINVLHYMGESKLILGTTRMVQSKKTLKDRIIGISNNKKFTIKSLIVGILVILLIAASGLTSKKEVTLEEYFVKEMKRMHYGDNGYNYSLIKIEENIIKKNDGVVIFLEKRSDEDVIFIAYFQEEKGKWQWKQTRGSSTKSPFNFMVMNASPYIYSGLVHSDISKVMVGDKLASNVKINENLNFWYAIGENENSVVVATKADGTEQVLASLKGNEADSIYVDKILNFFKNKELIIPVEVGVESIKAFGDSNLVLANRYSDGLLDLFVFDKNDNIIAWATGYAPLNKGAHINTLNFADNKIIFGKLNEDKSIGFIEIVSKETDIKNIELKDNNGFNVGKIGSFIKGNENFTETSFEIVLTDLTSFTELSLLNGDVVDRHGEVINYSNLLDFIEKYNKGIKGHVKVVRFTKEGDPIIWNLRNVGRSLEVYIDNSYDKFGSGKTEYYSAKAIEVKAEAIDGKNITSYYLNIDGINEPLLLLSYKE